jgi:hypothetical protein
MHETAMDSIVVLVFMVRDWFLSHRKIDILAARPSSPNRLLGDQCSLYISKSAAADPHAIAPVLAR